MWSIHDNMFIYIFFSAANSSLVKCGVWKALPSFIITLCLVWSYADKRNFIKFSKLNSIDFSELPFMLQYFIKNQNVMCIFDIEKLKTRRGVVFFLHKSLGSCMWILEDITVPKCGVFKPALVFHGLVLSGILPSPSLWTCHRIQREPLCETQAWRFKMWLPVTSTEALVHFFLLNFSPFMGTNENVEFPYYLS